MALGSDDIKRYVMETVDAEPGIEMLTLLAKVDSRIYREYNRSIMYRVIEDYVDELIALKELIAIKVGFSSPARHGHTMQFLFPKDTQLLSLFNP